MKLKLSAILFFYLACQASVVAAGLEKRTIILSSNERFDLVQGNSVKFKFKPLSEDARQLEITNDASSLGVAYLGKIKLKENFTALAALRSIADQIGESLKINFGVIADSNTSEALKENELLLLYHPQVTITLALVKPNDSTDYEIICTYALKDLTVKKASDSSIEGETEQNSEPKENEEKNTPSTEN